MKRQSSANKKKPDEKAAVDEYVSKQAILLRYGISERTLTTWIRKKKIPYLRISPRSFRYRISDVERALKRLQVNEVA
jgi:predicted site-specific integrase-resolvase